MGDFFEELRRRHVIRAGITYVVAAWVVLQVVDLLAPVLEWPDSVTRITLYLLVVGFPIALLLSWFYQITADGVQLDDESARSAPTAPVVDQRLNLVIIALLCAAVILFAYDKWWPRHAEDPSIAVLPFVNMSQSEDNEYFADGLTETLLHALAQNAALRVISRTTVFKYKNSNRDVREIARELGVANVLEGSVQRVGDEIRITAQLIRASDGSHLWSRKYDRKYVDIFDIHDEIAASVSGELSRSLVKDGQPLIPESFATRNTEAFDLYLRAIVEKRKDSFEALQNAEELLKKALTIDPNFTEAKELLAQNTVHLFDTGAIDTESGIASASALYEQVLAEQPGNIPARVFFLIKDIGDALASGDLAARVDAIEDFQSLVDEAPNNVDARMALARLLIANSMGQAAIEQYRIAISLDPANWEPLYMLGSTYGVLRDWDAARDQFLKALAIEPRNPNNVTGLGAISLKAGDAVDFVRRFQEAFELDPLDYETPYAIANLLYELELIDEGDHFRSRVLAIAPESPAADTLAIVRAIRADTEAESLEVARRLIRNDANNRRDAWIRAFRHLMLTAVRRGRTRDEMNFVEEYWPHFGDFEYRSVPWKVGVGRAHTLEIWRDLEDEAGVLRRVGRVEQGFAELNLPMSRVPHVQIDVLLLLGDLEGAIDAALTHMFSHSVLEHLDIKDRFVTPLYADFVADPRIAAALEKWDREFVQAREDVREYLAESR